MKEKGIFIGKSKTSNSSEMCRGPPLPFKGRKARNIFDGKTEKA
jgi:hypothetical protein